MTGRNTYLKNFLWRTAEHVGARGVSFLVSIVLARLLMPTDYGEIAIVLVLINLLSIFVDSGFGAALIQKKDADEIDFSSVFYFNLVICIVLYLALFILAPAIAKAYKMEHLTSVIRVQSLLLVISGVKSIQTAYVARHMVFKRFFFATLGGTIGAALIGILMAYKGFGVWALVAQSLFNNCLDTIILWFTVKWRPTASFSLKRLRDLFSYGGKLLLGTMLDKVYWEARQLIIGGVYTTADLAFFNRGALFPNEVEHTITGGLGDILFPAMSKIQHDPEQVKKWVKQVNLTHSYFLLPFMFGLAAIAESLTVVLFTEKWLPSVPYLRMFCMMYLFSSISLTNTNAAKALGHSEVWMRINFLRAPIHLMGLLLTIRWGVMAVAISSVCTTLIGELICAWSSEKLIDYSLLMQIRDILPHIAMSALMALCVWSISLLGWSAPLTLIVQIAVGMLIYWGLSALFRVKTYHYVLSNIKTIIKSKKEKKHGSL